MGSVRLMLQDHQWERTPPDDSVFVGAQPGTRDSLPVPQPTQSELQLTVRYGTIKFSYFNAF